MTFRRKIADFHLQVYKVNAYLYDYDFAKSVRCLISMLSVVPVAEDDLHNMHWSACVFFFYFYFTVVHKNGNAAVFQIPELRCWNCGGPIV